MENSEYVYVIRSQDRSEEGRRSPEILCRNKGKVGRCTLGIELRQCSEFESSEHSPAAMIVQLSQVARCQELTSAFAVLIFAITNETLA